MSFPRPRLPPVTSAIFLLIVCFILDRESIINAVQTLLEILKGVFKDGNVLSHQCVKLRIIQPGKYRRYLRHRPYLPASRLKM